MSLETLLEAAQFLEWSGEPNAKPRVKPPTDFHRYAKSASKEVVKNEPNGSDPSVSDGNSEDEAGNKRRPGGAGTREVHNKLEKNRRAHLKDCFDSLKGQIPFLDDKKMSNLNILRCAVRHIQGCKRKEKELKQEHQIMLAHQLANQLRINTLRKELAAMNIDFDINHFMASSADQDETHSSASTATADNDEPILSDVEGEEDMPAAKRLRLMTGSETTVTMVAATVKEEPCKDEPIDVVTVTSPSRIQGLTTNKSLETHVVKVPGVNVKGGARRLQSPPKATKLPFLTMSTSPALTTATVLQPGKQQQQQQPLRWAVDTTGNLISTKPATSTSVASITTATTSKPLKMPVTQILQQTLALRAQQQQLQQKQKLLQAQAQAAQLQLQAQAVSTQSGVSPAVITLTNNSALRPALTPTSRAPTISQLHNTIALTPAMLPSLLSPGSSIFTAASLQSKTSTVATPTAAKLGVMAPASIATATAATSITIATPAASTARGTTATHTVAAAPAVGTQAITLGGLKHVITPMSQIPTAQIITPAQLQLLMSQLSQQGNNNQTASIVSPTGTPQISGLQGIQTIPLTQLFTPVTMMPSTGVQVSPALTQAQLTNMVSSQVLKSLGIAGHQIPIIQQPLGLPVRPIVMVTMPSVATPTPSAVQVAVPITETS